MDEPEFAELFSRMTESLVKMESILTTQTGLSVASDQRMADTNRMIAEMRKEKEDLMILFDKNIEAVRAERDRLSRTVLEQAKVITRDQERIADLMQMVEKRDATIREILNQLLHSAGVNVKFGDVSGSKTM